MGRGWFFFIERIWFFFRSFLLRFVGFSVRIKEMKMFLSFSLFTMLKSRFVEFRWIIIRFGFRGMFFFLSRFLVIGE